MSQDATAPTQDPDVAALLREVGRLSRERDEALDQLDRLRRRYAGGIGLAIDRLRRRPELEHTSHAA